MFLLLSLSIYVYSILTLSFFFLFFFFLFQLDSMLHVPVLQACMFPVYEHSHAAVNRTDLVVVGSLAFLLSERVL